LHSYAALERYTILFQICIQKFSGREETAKNSTKTKRLPALLKAFSSVARRGELSNQLLQDLQAINDLSLAD